MPYAANARKLEYQKMRRARLYLLGKCSVCGVADAAVGKKKCGTCLSKAKGSMERFKNSNPTRALELSRASHLKRSYGITLEQYDAMVLQQNGVCAICLRPESVEAWSLSVDHDHVTGAVRGLLCRSCNAGLGSFEDNRETLRRALEYLEMRK